MLKVLKRYFSRDDVIVLSIFLLAAAIRTIPEVKAGIWPIGYDTFNTYAAELATYKGPLINWLKTANLIYFIFLPFKWLGFEPSFLMKFFGPIFFGALVISFYYWTRFFIGFNKLKSVLATLLVIFQLASLRLSWDLYRNELGLIFLFWALINLNFIIKPKNLILFLLFGVMAVSSNELVAAVLLITLVVVAIARIYRQKFKELMIIAMALIVFGLTFLSVLSSSGQILYDPHVIFTSESNNLVWRYVYQYQKEMSYQTLFDKITRLFWLLYQCILPFVIYGFWLLRKNLILTNITFWLLIGTFSSLIFAGTGIIVWERWLIMLAFPFAIYTIEGAFALGQFLAKLKNWGRGFKIVSKALAIIFWIGLLGILILRAWPFLTRSYPDAQPPLADDRINEYFPRTMVHNSVGIWKIEDILDCVDWLDKNVPPGAAVIVDNRWRGLMLTNFELDNRYIITNAWSEQWPRQTYEFAVLKGFKEVYLIWNTSKEIRYFDLVYPKGYTGIFKSKPL